MPSTPEEPAGEGLADRLREATKASHRRAERSGFVAAMIAGEATRESYRLHLVNLLPIYEALEAALDEAPAHRGLRRPEAFRAGALRRDLQALAGASGPAVILPEASAYAARIAEAGAAADGALVAHAYVRTLGDLNGGQILRRLLARRPGLPPEALTFYDFPDIADLAAFRRDYRDAIDRCGEAIGDAGPVVAEALAAFRLTIALSEAVLAAAGAPDRAAVA